MTVNELSQLYYLTREIAHDSKRLAELEGKSESPRASSLSGMPKAHGVNSIVEQYAVEIADLRAIIAAKQIQCIHERARLERFIADISDSEIREIFKRRFVEGLSWRDVAEAVGKGNTADRVKKVCYRYLKAENSAKIG